MKTLSESIKYTKEKKKHQLENLEKTHSIDAKNTYNNFINNTLLTKSTVSLYLEYESNWYIWLYIDESLKNNKNNLITLSISTKYSFLSNYLNYLTGTKAPKYRSCILLNRTTMHLGQMLFLGWDDKAIKYGNLLLSMLSDKYYKGGTAKPLYNWFMLSMFCKWQNIELKMEGLKVPDNLGIYQQALDNLFSKDTILINNIIENMTINHIKNSDEYVTTDEYGNEESTEFSSSDYFIFPVEILMFLSIRKRLGLPDYDTIKNELLSLPINKIPEQPVPYPKDDIIDKVFEKLYKENPDYPRF